MPQLSAFDFDPLAFRATTHCAAITAVAVIAATDMIFKQSLARGKHLPKRKKCDVDYRPFPQICAKS
ncbi:hypothetical protein SAMN06265374_3219 [Roseibium denhamense]|uniref:Uncharacterized protein n=1 Tax=Roseibium denhamense TaxID=76305 RepID=A0ABY1PAM5_9HYPH|nr:hypothetical protein SAMN06265374_3219 [Roseibium denhamense]